MTYVWRGMVCHVFMTCDLCQRVVRVKHKLGERFTRQGETTGMFGELQGRSRDVAERLGCALEGYEKLSGVEDT